jgi:hypothetical protein
MDEAAGRRLQAAITTARGQRTVTEVATAAGVLRQTLYKWFGGGTPNLIELRKVARQLDMPVASLVSAWDGFSGPGSGGAPNDLSPATRAVLEAQADEIEGLRLAVADLAAALRLAGLPSGSKR